jgi:hypothetical protein
MAIQYAEGVGGELSVKAVMAQVQKIQELMKLVMKENEHYGKIPGTDKPTLLKAGAEKLGFVFRLVATYDVNEHDLGNGHREYRVLCTVKKMGTGEVVGQGVGVCSTLESKYRWRNQNRKCPVCGAETIIQGKEEFGGGWLCWKKKGGCGAKFPPEDARINGQAVGKVENTDIADVYNTVLKIGKKRAHVDAMITSCAASDIFTQDLEEMQVTETARPAPVEENKLSKDPDVQTAMEEIGRLSVDKDAARQQIRDILTTQITKADVLEAMNAYIQKLDQGTF